MNHIFCLRWGDLYSKDYTDTLHKNLKDNLTVDFEFHEFTDDDLGPESDQWEEVSQFFMQTRDHRHYTFDDKRDHGGLSHFNKILMMANNFGIPEGNFLYLDLDTYINKNIDWIFETDESKPWIVKNNHFAGERFRKNFPIHRSPMLNSSVLKWKDTQLKPIYDYTKKNLDKVMFTYNAIDNYMQDQFCGFHNGKPHFFNFFERGKVVNVSESTDEEIKESDIAYFAGLSIHEKDANLMAIQQSKLFEEAQVTND